MTKNMEVKGNAIAAMKDKVVAKVEKVAKKAGLMDDHGLRLSALADLKDVALPHIPDVRGWKVELRDGTQAGQVSRIIVDQQQGFVPRYLDVRLDATLFGATKPVSYDLLVPIGRAQLAKERSLVLLPFVTRERVADLPMLSHGEISFERELAILKSFGLAAPFTDANAMYAHEWFDVRAFLMAQPA